MAPFPLDALISVADHERAAAERLEPGALANSVDVNGPACTSAA